MRGARLGQIVALFACIAVAVAFVVVYLETGFSGWMAVVGILIISFGAIAYAANRKLDQQARNEDAQSVSDDLLAQAEAASNANPARLESILYLRPFIADESIFGSNPRRALRFFGMLYSPPSRSALDDIIQVALRRFGELVSIGTREGDSVAAAITATEDDWRNRFASLARRAALIVLFVGMRPGTVWECRTVINDPRLLAKTIFLIPPSGLSAADPKVFSPDQAYQVLRDGGLRFPNLPDGAGVVFSATGELICSLRLMSFSSGQVRVDRSELATCAWWALPKGSYGRGIPRGLVPALFGVLGVSAVTIDAIGAGVPFFPVFMLALVPGAMAAALGLVAQLVLRRFGLVRRAYPGEAWLSWVANSVLVVGGLLLLIAWLFSQQASERPSPDVWF